MTRHRTLQPDPRDLLGNVVEAVLEAGALLHAEFHRPDGPRRTSSSKTPVDDQVERHLRRRLQALHGCGWHGEELPRAWRGDGDLWVVDPQDGTSPFLRGRRGSAVSAALVREGVPVLGVVYV
jgi:fructose-1,6-bisphosphatase/inositol monophosphatase family enzyme